MLMVPKVSSMLTYHKKNIITEETACYIFNITLRILFYDNTFGLV